MAQLLARALFILAASEDRRPTTPSHPHPPHFLQAEPQNVEPQPLAKFPNYHCRDSSIFEKRQCSISFLCAVQVAEIRSINSLTSLTRLQKSKYSYTQQTTTGDQRSARCIDIRARWKRSKADWNHTTLGRSSPFPVRNLQLAASAYAYVRLLLMGRRKKKVARLQGSSGLQ